MIDARASLRGHVDMFIVQQDERSSTASRICAARMRLHQRFLAQHHLEGLRSAQWLA
jgi:hypothetical protein